MPLQRGEFCVGAKTPGERKQSRMLAFVLLNDGSIRLVLQKPEQREQFGEHRNRAGEGSAPDRPAARDELVEFCQPGDPVPEPISCGERDAPDVARHDRDGTERTGFERRPKRVVLIITRNQLSQNVELGVRYPRRSEPSGRRLPVAYTISSDSNNPPPRISQHRAHANIAPYMRLPSQCQCYLPRLFKCRQAAAFGHDAFLELTLRF